MAGKPSQIRRALLKISGEALAGSNSTGLDLEIVAGVAEQIVAATRLGVQIATVVGAGNLVRGAEFAKLGRDFPNLLGAISMTYQKGVTFFDHDQILHAK